MPIEQVQTLARRIQAMDLDVLAVQEVEDIEARRDFLAAPRSPTGSYPACVLLRPAGDRDPRPTADPAAVHAVQQPPEEPIRDAGRRRCGGHCGGGPPTKALGGDGSRDCAGAYEARWA